MNASRSLHSLTFNRPQRRRCPRRLGVCAADRPTQPKYLIVELETPEVGGANHFCARLMQRWQRCLQTRPRWEKRPEKIQPES